MQCRIITAQRRSGLFLILEKICILDKKASGRSVYCGVRCAVLCKRKMPRCAAASAIKCTRQGGRAGIANAETVKHFLETGSIDYSEIDKRAAIYKNGLF